MQELPPGCWRAQMLARGLATATIKANCGTVERFQGYAGTFHIGESPAEAAVREAREEIGTDVHLVELLDVLGGPDYEVQYANGDRTA